MKPDQLQPPSLPRRATGFAWRTLMYCWNRHVRRVRVESPPIFICGCGHSGTTLLLAIASTHSKIYAIPYESSLAMNERPDPFLNAFATFDRWTIAAGKRRWVEKTPRHINHVGKILEWSPDARVIIIVRDGRDVACSLRRQRGSLEDCMQRWVDENRGSQQYWGDPRVHVCRYEDLVTDLEPTVRAVMEFVGEPFEPAQLEYYRKPRTYLLGTIGKITTDLEREHAARRNRQVNQPVFDGRGGWKELSDDEVAVLDRVGGELLREFGYIDS